MIQITVLQRNIDKIKKLSLDSMFSQMKEHQQRFYRLNDLKTRIEDNKK